jgi:hypothetical protein
MMKVSREGEAAVDDYVRAQASARAQIPMVLQTNYNTVLELCNDPSNWPDLSAARNARFKKALRKLQQAWIELIELATPAKRGRPPKAKAGAE